jgi:hypothetical protein
MKNTRLYIMVAGIVVLICIVWSASFWNLDSHTALGSLSGDKIVIKEIPAPSQIKDLLNKTVAVQGRLAAIDLLPDEKTRVSLKTAVGITVSCIVATNDLFENVEALEFNKEVEVKGYCTGLNEDLLLTRCTVSKVTNQPLYE